MAVFTLKRSKWTLFWYQIRNWRGIYHYRKAVSIARKRAKHNPRENIFCVSRMRGKVIYHFYRSKPCQT